MEVVALVISIIGLAATLFAIGYQLGLTWLFYE